jgi:hypothetical protein
MLTDFGDIAHRAAGIVGEVSAEGIAALCQSSQKNFSVRIRFVQRPGSIEAAEAIYSRRLLSEDSARSENGRTGEQPDKFTSAHVFPCPFRKSYPNVLVMQPSQDRNGDNDAGPLDYSMQGRFFL